MHISELRGHVGQVVLLDLVSGMQVCTEIKEIDEVAGKAITTKIMIFQIISEPQDPMNPPGPNNPVVQKVNALPYGGPFMNPMTENVLYAENIIMAHSPIEPIEKSYLQAVSGIEIVGANALGDLGNK